MVYKIYAIICNITGETYFGSTKDFSRRMYDHKSKKQNCSSSQILERGDYRVEILEEDDYTLEEAREREDFYYQNFECVNKYTPGVPGRTKKEWCKVNKEAIKEKDKEWYEANKERIEEKNRAKMTCECGSTFRKDTKARHEKTNKHQLFIQNKK